MKSTGESVALSQSGKVSAKQTRLSPARRTAILKALADPNRFELLERIVKAACPMACNQVGSALTISPATLSHHIKELEAAGLIKIERRGKFHLLSPRPGVLDAVVETLGALKSSSCLADSGPNSGQD